MASILYVFKCIKRVLTTYVTVCLEVVLSKFLCFCCACMGSFVVFAHVRMFVFGVKKQTYCREASKSSAAPKILSEEPVTAPVSIRELVRFFWLRISVFLLTVCKWPMMNWNYLFVFQLFYALKYFLPSLKTINLYVSFGLQA